MRYIVITGQIIGGNGKPFETVWYSDMEEKRTLKNAMSHGFRTRGSDDFRIGHKRCNVLVAISFMGEKFFDKEEVEETASQIGLAYK
jgi:hypothetical protein